jgi:hypothetical protein
MGRRPNTGGEIRFATSKAQQDILEHLAENTPLGKSPNQVAQYLLTKALSEMNDKGK